MRCPAGRHLGALTVILCLAAPSAGTAQAQVARAFSPRVNPLDPDEVAFERLIEDRREVWLLDLASGDLRPLRPVGEEGETDPLALVERSGEEGRYLGQFSWRPVLDGYGRQWFAYVAGEDNSGVRLHLGFLDTERNVSPFDHVVQVEGEIHGPVWSPDGGRLAFVADGRLHMVQDLRLLLRDLGAQVEAVPVGAASYAQFNPAWSPTGDHLAYHALTEIGGRQNYTIEVLPMGSDDASSDVRPAVVTQSLPQHDELRPSWSADGRYIAFYVTATGASEEEVEVDIGVVEVFRDDQGKIYRGEVLSGRNQRIATRVLPNERRGPAWTWLPWLSRDTTVTQAVAFVQRDEEQNHPIYVAGVEPWRDRRSPEEYLNPISERQGWNTANNRFLATLARLDRHEIRFVYVSQVLGGEQVQHRDFRAPWLKDAVFAAPTPATVIGASGANVGAAVDQPVHGVVRGTLHPDIRRRAGGPER